MEISRKFACMAATAIALSACNPATKEDPAKPQESANEVSLEAPAARLSDVGKRVADGVIQVDPEALRGKRLVIDDFGPGDPAEAIKICVGYYSPPICVGVWIEFETDEKKEAIQ